MAAKSEMFISDNKVQRFGHLVNAVPGSVAGLLKAHKDYGSLPLPELLKPSIELAREGFEVSYDLNYVLEWGKESMLMNETSKKKFYDQSLEPLKVKSIFKQPLLSKTIEKIAMNGKEAFYEGEIAEWIADESLSNGGLITIQDMLSLIHI